MRKILTLEFRISSFCDGGGCVAVAESAGKGVIIKNTTTGKTLAFSRDEWTAFTKGVKNSEFELED